MRISFIIVSWNTREKTCACVISLQKYMPEHEIIIVDNHSSDDSVKALKSRFSGIRVIENKENRGFGAANNQGAAGASGDVLCFINSDTEVLDSGLVCLAERLSADPMIGAIGPKIVFGDGRFQHSYGRFPTKGSCLAQFGFEFFMPIKSPWHWWLRYGGKIFKKTRTVDWVSGCCLMIRKDVFCDINGWDERYFAYFEDPDLCRRLMNRGLQTVYDPSALIIHHHGASFFRCGKAIRIKHSLNSSCIFLFDGGRNFAAQGYKRVLKICWRAILLATFFLRANLRIGEKRMIIKDLLLNVH